MMCVFFTSNRSFYPSPSSTPSVRADSSSQRYKLCRHKTTTHQRSYYIGMHCVCSSHQTVLSTRRHPAQPVSVPILHPSETQALWSHNNDSSKQSRQCNDPSCWIRQVRHTQQYRCVDKREKRKTQRIHSNCKARMGSQRYCCCITTGGNISTVWTLISR